MYNLQLTQIFDFLLSQDHREKRSTKNFRLFNESLPYFIGKSQHLLQIESGGVQAGFGQHQALHPGHRLGTLFSEQGKIDRNFGRRSFFMGVARP